MPRGKRQLSRKGCFSCKKLKIKCDEAKPSCEYCSHTGRGCVYPEDTSESSTSSGSTKSPEIQMDYEISREDLPDIHFYEGVPSPYSPIAESCEESINGQNDENGEHEQSEDFPQFPNALLSQPYNATCSQMQMTRFELRLLRFFHDQCIPYVTFNANQKGNHIWRNIFPKYFASSNLVRQATYAMACLNLWPVTNLPQILASDNSECEFHISPQTTSGRENPFSHVFDKSGIFENTNESIFSVTTSYFISTLQTSQKYMGDSQQSSHLTYDDLANLYFSGFLIFAYVGVHPHCVLPLIDYDMEYPSDFIGIFSSMRSVFLSSPPGMREQILETLMEYSFLTPTADSEKIGFVEVLRSQLRDYHFANTTFSEIGTKICEENDTLKRNLFLLECCYLSALREGHPTPLFKFLVLLEYDFIVLARSRNYFALRILFTFSCIAIYCQFYLSFDENVWASYIGEFVQQYSPLCDSDAALYKLVVTDHKFADPNKFAHDMRVLNRMSFELGNLEAPPVNR